MNRWEDDGIEETNHELAASGRLHRSSWNTSSNKILTWADGRTMELKKHIMSWQHPGGCIGGVGTRPKTKSSYEQMGGRWNWRNKSFKELRQNTVCALAKMNSGRFNLKLLSMFYPCTHSDRYRAEILNRLFLALLNASDVDGCRLWLLSTLPGIEKNIDFISVVINLVNFQMWKWKLRKECIQVETFLENLSYSIKKALKLSDNLRTEMQKANFFVCRHYSDLNSSTDEQEQERMETSQGDERSVIL